MDDRSALAELQRMLAAALELADRLELMLVAIRVDEALHLVAATDATTAH